MTQENEIKRPIQDLEHEPIKPLDNSEKGSKVSQALETVTTTAEKVQRQPVIAHLIRATERFNDRLGNQFGAAITYFSFLSMIPILMVSFAAGGFVLASHPMLLQDIFDKILQNISDPTLAATLKNTINTAVQQRTTVGLVGLAVALYSGINWMGNLREAITHYQLNVGTSDKHTSVDGYYSHDGSLAQVDLSANYHEGQYTSAGLSLQGGATLTAQGGALHRTQNMGGTRLLIDADGVADVPVEGNGAAVYTNMFGKAVVSDVNNYYRNQAYIDLNKLPENAEATQSVVQATLTEGAIGYRKFAVISGQKAMAVLRLQDGSHPPFGAEVKNDNQQTVGLVDDDGNVYLAGVKPGEHMSVFWSGVAHCDINLPDPLPADLFNGLLLPCQHKGNVAPVVPDDIKPVIQEQTQQVTPGNPPVSISANQ